MPRIIAVILSISLVAPASYGWNGHVALSPNSGRTAVFQHEALVPRNAFYLQAFCVGLHFRLDRRVEALSHPSLLPTIHRHPFAFIPMLIALGIGMVHSTQPPSDPEIPEDPELLPVRYLFNALNIPWESLNLKNERNEQFHRQSQTIQPDMQDRFQAMFRDVTLKAGEPFEIVFGDEIPVALILKPGPIFGEIPPRPGARVAAIAGLPDQFWEDWVSEHDYPPSWKHPVMYRAMYSVKYKALQKPLMAFASTYDGVIHSNGPESEKLKSTQLFLNDFPDSKGKRVLDLGTGIGPLGFKAIEEGANEVVGLEKQPFAFWSTRLNIDEAGYSDRFSLYESMPPEAGEFDLIVCNPPLESELLFFLPRLWQLSANDPQGALYKSSFEIASRHLTPSGEFHLAYDEASEDEVRARAAANHLQVVEVRRPKEPNLDNYVVYMLKKNSVDPLSIKSGFLAVLTNPGDSSMPSSGQFRARRAFNKYMAIIQQARNRLIAYVTTHNAFEVREFRTLIQTAVTEAKAFTALARDGDVDVSVLRRAEARQLINASRDPMSPQRLGTYTALSPQLLEAYFPKNDAPTLAFRSQIQADVMVGIEGMNIVATTEELIREIDMTLTNESADESVLKNVLVQFDFLFATDRGRAGAMFHHFVDSEGKLCWRIFIDVEYELEDSLVFFAHEFTHLIIRLLNPEWDNVNLSETSSTQDWITTATQMIVLAQIKGPDGITIQTYGAESALTNYADAFQKGRLVSRITEESIRASESLRVCEEIIQNIASEQSALWGERFRPYVYGAFLGGLAYGVTKQVAKVSSKRGDNRWILMSALNRFRLMILIGPSLTIEEAIRLAGNPSVELESYASKLRLAA